MKPIYSLLFLYAALWVVTPAYALEKEFDENNDEIFTQDFNTVIPAYIKDIRHYYRVNADTATGGTIQSKDAIKELKSSGFKTVIDLRQAPEGVERERGKVEQEGLTYVNLPVSGSTALSDETLIQFNKLIEKVEKPVLIHCASGNRAGAVWANHLLSKGATLEEAIEQGQRIGMQSLFAIELRETHASPK